jgi:hypothetical protein
MLDSGDTSKYIQIPLWVDKAQANWNLIDQHSANIMRFKNLAEFRADRICKEKFRALWDDMDVNKIK